MTIPAPLLPQEFSIGECVSSSGQTRFRTDLSPYHWSSPPSRRVAMKAALSLAFALTFAASASQRIGIYRRELL
jgi:hypothetical protein